MIKVLKTESVSLDPTLCYNKYEKLAACLSIYSLFSQFVSKSLSRSVGNDSQPGNPNQVHSLCFLSCRINILATPPK